MRQRGSVEFVIAGALGQPGRKVFASQL